MNAIMTILKMPLGAILLVVFLAFVFFSVGAKLLVDFLIGLFKKK